MGAVRYVAAALALFAAALVPAAQGDDRVAYAVPANAADPGVSRFLGPNLVLFDRAASPQSPLLVFLPGTGGHPAGVRLFLGVAADAGYRVIGLQYDNEPAAMQQCFRSSDPACTAVFRQSRLLGGPAPPSETPPDEAIVERLIRLLQFLAGNHPDEGWNRYLANGVPDWRRIAVAGHSQGGGMAAFLAKRVSLARVLLFSGPPDYIQRSQEPAPWLKEPSATPLEHWFGLYHRDESLAPPLQRAYAALGLAADHIRVLSLAPAGMASGPFDAFHGSVIGDRLTPRAADGTPAYAADWEFLLGRPRR